MLRFTARTRRSRTILPSLILIPTAVEPTETVESPKNAQIAPSGNASVEPPTVIQVELPPLRRSARARLVPDHFKDYVT